MMIPFDPSELWTGNGSAPPPVSTPDDRSTVRRRIVGTAFGLLAIHLPTIKQVLYGKL